MTQQPRTPTTVQAGLDLTRQVGAALTELVGGKEDKS